MDAHNQILAWMAQGRLPQATFLQALDVAGVAPGPTEWRKFIDQLALWLGVVFCAAAVVYFFAYNWQEMGRYTKFALVELLILCCLGPALWIPSERAVAKAALLAATLLTGVLLALLGQVYQTGADTFELFAVWALAVLPWVALGRFGALWLVWIGLLNLAAILYYRTFGVWFGLLWGGHGQLWIGFWINTLALICWEGAPRFGVDWLRQTWSARILAFASGGLITALAVLAIYDTHRRVPALLGFFAWIAVAHWFYRYRLRDAFVLAGGVLSLIIFVAALLSRHLLNTTSAGGFLAIGIVVIGLSALGGWWLKSLAAERAEE